MMGIKAETDVTTVGNKATDNIIENLSFVNWLPLYMYSIH